MRRFELHRDADASGVSGTGVVAQGIQFDDGICALRWLSEYRSTAVYESAGHIERIHGHGGMTRLVWLDPPATTVSVQVSMAPDVGEQLRALTRDGRPPRRQQDGRLRVITRDGTSSKGRAGTR